VPAHFAHTNQQVRPGREAGPYQFIWNAILVGRAVPADCESPLSSGFILRRVWAVGPDATASGL